MSAFTNKRVAAAYLAAMVDGEGSISCYPVPRPTGRTDWNRGVFVYNTDPCLIQACIECCDTLGIECKAYDTRRQTMFVLVIRRREAVTKFAKVVPLQSLDKVRKLGELLASYKERKAA